MLQMLVVQYDKSQTEIRISGYDYI